MSNRPTPTETAAPQFALRDQIHEMTSSLGHGELVRDTLAQVDSPDDLVRFLHRYTTFNGNFAGGVANLAGAFHIRQDLFRDPSEPINVCADRSARIASQIFQAAEDEYADRSDHSRITHRDLGQYLLKSTVEHYNLNPQSVDERFPFNSTTVAALDAVFVGYCCRGDRTEEDLFRGLGFHIGSELSADQEFNAIDAYLQSTNPELVELLNSQTTHLGQACYRWVKLHTYVELEHLDHAVEAAILATEFYQGGKSPEQLQQLVVEGFEMFAGTLRQFVGGILQEF